jgi:hypothetical protein
MNTSDHRRRPILPRVALGALVIGAVVAITLWSLRSTLLPALVEPAQAAAHPSRTRVDSAAAMPAARTALVETFDQLKSRADAGDARAASRLYNDLLRCRVSASINTDVAQATKNALLDHKLNLTPQELDAKEKNLARMQRLADSARANQSLCLGVSNAYLVEFAPAALRAAELGDDEAASCYVDGDFLGKQGVVDHPEWHTQYKQRVLDIADQSVAHGNWTMVRQFYDALGDTRATTPFAQITGRDVAQQYRYAKLMQLGAEASDSGAIDDEVEALLPSLSENDIAVGDIWARNTYRRAFAPHPERHAVISTSVCQMAKD